MVKFVVVGTQRTGTTLIRTSLDSHSKIRCIGEAFKYRTRKASYYKGKLGYRSYVQRSFKNRLMHYIRRNTLIKEYLDELYAMDGYSAIGFKLMFSQSKKFAGILDYIYENQIKTIHVVRENVLKTIVSRHTARARKLHHAEKKVPLKKIVLPINGLIRKLDKISSENQDWWNLLDTTPRIRIVYESFVNNTENEINRLLNFLNQDYEHLSSPLIKLNPDSLQDILINYVEVRNFLKGTSYEWCLN